jgi:hypothetical protein
MTQLDIPAYIYHYLSFDNLKELLLERFTSLVPWYSTDADTETKIHAPPR